MLQAQICAQSLSQVPPVVSIIPLYLHTSFHSPPKILATTFPPKTLQPMNSATSNLTHADFHGLPTILVATFPSQKHNHQWICTLPMQTRTLSKDHKAKTPLASNLTYMPMLWPSNNFIRNFPKKL